MLVDLDKTLRGWREHFNAGAGSLRLAALVSPT